MKNAISNPVERDLAKHPFGGSCPKNPDTIIEADRANGAPEIEVQRLWQIIGNHR